MLTSMERVLPPEYRGWQAHEQGLRRLSTPELIEEIQDGPPDRRLAAISVIDLADVPRATVEDWIRTLPEPEANELAGAIPAQRPHATIADDRRWAELARLGYDSRRLPTFLVMLFSSVEAMEAKNPAAAAELWGELADWVTRVYREATAAGDNEAREDLLLFVFENYLDRAPLFRSFVDLIEHDTELALRVSANPAVFVAGLSLAQQRECLEAAANAGGLAFNVAWRALHEPGI